VAVTDLLLVVLILLVPGVLVFLIVLAKRRPVGDAGAEAELRAALQTERDGRVQAETRLEEERKNLEEQRRRLGEDQAQLKEAFSALSADALKDSRTQFLSQADEKLRPIQSLLKDYEQKLDAIEKARNTAYGGLEQHLKSLASAHDVLQKEAHQLSTALRSPTVRGRWGEMTLRRVVEVAGMNPHCDFTEQADVETEEGRQRPDMVIHLPGRRSIVVDSKVPLTAYMDAAESSEASVREAVLARHAQDVRKHVRALGQKAYFQRGAGGGPDAHGGRDAQPRIPCDADDADGAPERGGARLASAGDGGERRGDRRDGARTL
jgi:DNA recombination protein RmuC